MLHGFLAAGGCLDAKLAELAAGRAFNPQRNHHQLPRWLLAGVGPVGIVAFAGHLGCSDNVVRQRGGTLEASRDLFPCLDVVIAYRLLFGIYSGIVPDGIDDLVTDDIDWAGDSTILLSYVKGRTAVESLTLPRRAVRLLEQWLAQWLAHSALLRSHADPGQRRQFQTTAKAPPRPCDRRLRLPSVPYNGKANSPAGSDVNIWAPS